MVRDPKDIILKTLMEKGKTSVRDLQRKTGISPRIFCRRLKQLKRASLIEEDKQATWRRGQRIFLSLSVKGQETAIRNATLSLVDALKTIRRFTNALRTDSYSLTQIRERQHMRKQEYAKRFTQLAQEAKGITDVEYHVRATELWRQYNDDIPAAVSESLEAILRMYVELRPGPIKDVVIGITEKHGLLVFPVEPLKIHGFLQDFWAR